MNLSFKKNIQLLISKATTQRGITLLSVFGVIVVFSILVAYNTIHKKGTDNQTVLNVQKEQNTQTVKVENTSKKISTAVPETNKAVATLEPSAVPQATPVPIVVEQASKVADQALAEINQIVISDKEADQKTGKIKIDGSSIVGTISQLVADKYRDYYRGVEVSVGIAGSDDGLKEFIAGNLDICGTTRKITPEETQACIGNGIDYAEVKLAYDSAVVIVNNSNDWVDSMSITQLRKIWDPKSRARLWSDVNQSWPSNSLKPYNANDDVLTSSYFCNVLYSNSFSKLSNLNTTVEKSRELIDSVAGDYYAIGFCSYSVYQENKDKVKAVGVFSNNGPVIPTYDTIKDGTYTPLSRPLYMYVKRNSLGTDYFKAYLKLYIENIPKFVKASGYLPCEDTEYSNYLNLVN